MEAKKDLNVATSVSNMPDMFTHLVGLYNITKFYTTGLSEKMDGILNRYNLKSTGRIYTFGVLKCSEKFKVLDLP